MKIEILIIDDSLEIGEALQIIMQNLGFACKYFDSAEKAMPYFQNELNPVIFLDIFMPNQNGLDLLPTIKKISPFTQVVMMTGESDIENVVASLKNKASDFLLKPFSMESVKVAVERGVEYYKLLNITKDDYCLSFYYTEEIEGKTIIIFGDIEGNAVTSSFIGLLTISMLKDILRKETVPARVLSMLNDELYFRINIHTLTAVCLLIDPSLKQIHYANGGNTNPILVTDNVNEITYLNSEVSNIIGVMPGTEFITKSIPISENSILFLYNPGFLPSETNSKKEFETFVLNLQTIYNKTANFDSVKKEMDKYIKENLKNDSKKNLSFFLQKF